MPARITIPNVLHSILIRLDMNEFDVLESLRGRDMISERLDSIEEHVLELDHRLDDLEVLLRDAIKELGINRSSLLDK